MGIRARHRNDGGQAGVEHPDLPGARRRQRCVGDGVTPKRNASEDRSQGRARTGASGTRAKTPPESAGPALKRGEKTFEVNGGDVVYEILGKEGGFIALTPGGRYSKDIEGLRPLAKKLVDGGYRVLLWDRPNCGKSDIQFYGQSESHMRAETLHALITGLDIGPCIIAGGSGGARDSMLTTMLYPEIVTKLVVWSIVGGVYGSFALGAHYIMPTLHAARALGMEGLLRVGEWKERIGDNPRNNNRILALNNDEFLKVQLRWLNAYVSKPGQSIPGVPDEMFDDIKV